MEIGYAVFAEYVQITSDGRMNVLGADLHTLRVNGPPPWNAPSFFLAMSIRLEREDCGQLHHFTADLMDPDDRAIDPHVEQDFIAPVPENPEMIAARMSVLLQLTGVALPALGVYHLNVRVENREQSITREKRIPLRVTDNVPQQ